jgi:8-oxo-dGTP pyrophosphatase MutT (NUDIX family)
MTTLGPTGSPSSSLAEIRSALRETLPGEHEGGDGRVAAVAAVLREYHGNVELLFIRRARRRGDPWSGHMAWPGGKREPEDASTVACAIRETREELGLDLADTAELIGALRVWRRAGASPKGLRAVFSYVFILAGDWDLHPSGEVQEAVWIPLTSFTAWAARRPWSWLARWLPPVPPAFRYEGRLIWGLTLWMLADLVGKIGRQKTEGRRQKTEGRRQKTEDRRQKA